MSWNPAVFKRFLRAMKMERINAIANNTAPWVEEPDADARRLAQERRAAQERRPRLITHTESNP